jgi:hypothetical protein
MVSSTTLIIIIVAVIVLIIAVTAVIIYSRSKPSSGTTGVTGASGSCASQCNSYIVNCTATNQVTYGFTGSTGLSCPASCLGTTGTSTVSGCSAPVCNSPYCGPQQALYSSLNSSNSLINFCSTGGTGITGITGIQGTGIPLTSSNCTDNTTSGIFLSQLSVKSSSVANNQLFPIFITTINKSIYQPVQPTPPSGVNVSTIAVNMTDPTVSNNPYLLYWNPTTEIISFERLDNIITNLNINNSIFIYNTDGTGSLSPFTYAATGFSLGSDGILEASLFGQYEGSFQPCGIDYFVTAGFNGSQSLIYNPNNGLFQISQYSKLDSFLYTANLVPATDTTTNPPNTLVFTATDYNPGVSFNTGCEFNDLSRFYSISAINQFL